MSDRLDLLDYYTLLGVDSDAGAAEVKRAFRRFARKYHPDRFAGAPEDKRARATQIYRRGSEAFQVLVDPIARRAYDRVLRLGRIRLSAEARERAEALEKQRQAGGGEPTPQRVPIQSPQALAFYNRSAEAARAGQWREAWRAMRTALELEPTNPLLKARFAQIEARLRVAR